MSPQEEQFRENLSFVTHYPAVFKLLEDLATRTGWSKNRAFDFVMLLAAEEFDKNPKTFVEKLLALKK